MLCYFGNFTEIDETVAKAALHAMWSISSEKSGAKHLTASGACGVLMKCFRQYPDPEARLTHAIVVIMGNICLHDFDAKKQFTDVGACDLILSILRDTSDEVDEKAVDHAVWTMRLLAKDNEEAVNQFVAADACTTLLYRLRQHTADVNIAAESLRVIKILSSTNKSMIEQLKSWGAHEIIEVVMSTYITNDEIQTNGRSICLTLKEPG